MRRRRPLRRSMLTLAAAIGLGAILGTIATPARAQTPGTRTLPPGDGRDLAAAACSQCHALNVIMSMREGGGLAQARHQHGDARRAAQSARGRHRHRLFRTANFGPGRLSARRSRVAPRAHRPRPSLPSRCRRAPARNWSRRAAPSATPWNALRSSSEARRNGPISSPTWSAAARRQARRRRRSSRPYLAANFGGE